VIVRRSVQAGCFDPFPGATRKETIALLPRTKRAVSDEGHRAETDTDRAERTWAPEIHQYPAEGITRILDLLGDPSNRRSKS
jgi:hypothetical protein